MRVTIAEVARRARVSKTTVSRVLNNKADVDAATAVRVREVIAATGYIPSAGAVGLARGVPDHLDEVARTLLRRIESGA